MMKRLKKILLGSIVINIIGINSLSFASTYTVEPGDNFWKISNKLSLNMSELMKVNNASEKTVIYVGQNLKLPLDSLIVKNEVSKEEALKTYNYTVKSGDGLWAISNKVGMNLNNLLELNKLTQESTIYPGQNLKIDREYKATESNSKDNNIIENIITNNSVQNGDYGALLDWFEEVQYIIPIGKDFKVTDLKTKKTFNLRRTYGENHADVETLTAKDTEILKDIWGGFSWVRRAVIVEVDGIKIAASLAGMPHSGNEDAPANAYTSWRSENYGAGTNLDSIKGNEMHGHLDLHFFNSKGHANPVLNADHQRCVKEAAGII